MLEVTSGRHEVVVGTELTAQVTKRLSHQPAEGVASDGLPVAARGGDAQPRLPLAIRGPSDECLPPREGLAASENALELPSLEEPSLLGIGLRVGIRHGVVR